MATFFSDFSFELQKKTFFASLCEFDLLKLPRTILTINYLTILTDSLDIFTTITKIGLDEFVRSRVLFFLLKSPNRYILDGLATIRPFDDFFFKYKVWPDFA